MINKINNKNFKLENRSRINSLHLKKVFKILTTLFLFIGGIISIFFAFSSAINGTGPRDRFGDAYNVQYEVQLSSENTSGENNLNTSGSTGLSLNNEEASRRLKASADAFKRYLIESNIDFDGVQYEINEQSLLSNNPVGTINTNIFNINALDSTAIGSEQKFPRSQAEVVFSSFETNFIEIVPFNTTNDQALTNGFFPNNLNKPIYNNYGLNFQNAFIQDGNIDDLNNFNNSTHLSVVANTPLDISDFPDSVTSRANGSGNVTELDLRKMIIFNNPQKLVQMMNYSNLLQFWSKQNNLNDFIRFTLKEYSPDIASSIPDLSPAFANLPYPSEIISKDVYDNDILVTNENGLPSISETESSIIRYLNTTSSSFWTQFSTLKTWTDETFSMIPNSQNSPQIVTILDLYYMANGVRREGQQYIPITTPSTRSNVIANSIYNSTSQTLVQEMAIIGEINLNNYSEFFTQTNTIDENPDSLISPGRVSDLTTITWPLNVLNQFDFGFNVGSNISDYLPYVKNSTSLVKSNIGNLGTLINPPSFANRSVAETGGNSIFSLGSSINIKSILQDKISGLSAYNSMFLAIGIILLLVGIIVSILYRIPGLFASLAMASAVTFTTGILTLLSFNFSFGLFLGITFITILSLASILLILERCRKRFIEKKPAFEAGVGSIRKTLISIIDIHIGAILIAIGLVFLGTNDLRDFGFAIIVGSVTSFLSVIAFFILNFYLFVSDIKNRSIKLYFFGGTKNVKIQKNLKKIPVINNSTHSILETGLKVHFNWKILVSIIAILFVIAIIVMTLILTIGFPNSLEFNSGQVIYIRGNNVDAFFNTYKSLLGIEWTPIIVSNDLLSFGKSNLITSDNLLRDLLAINQTASINQTIASDVASINIFRTDILAILAGIGFAGIYGLIRFNFYGGLPIFISTVLGTWVGISFSYIFFLQINSDSVIAFAFAAAISLLMSMGYLSVSNSRFSSKQIFNQKNVQQFINANANNLKYYWIAIVLIVISITLSQFAFASASFYWVIGITLVSSIFGIGTSIATVMVSYYGLILLRQLYVKNTIHDSISNNSSKYDLLEEEIIKGINYYE